MSSKWFRVALMLLLFIMSACGSGNEAREAAGEVDEADAASRVISFRGTTVLLLGQLLVRVPASAMPSGLTDCVLQAEDKGSSGEYGFDLDDTVWDVRILCDKENLRELFNSITVCILPGDGEVDSKAVYQLHSGKFTALPITNEKSEYVCGLAEGLSLFTLGFED